MKNIILLIFGYRCENHRLFYDSCGRRHDSCGKWFYPCKMCYYSSRYTKYYLYKFTVFEGGGIEGVMRKILLRAVVFIMMLSMFNSVFAL